MATQDANISDGASPTAFPARNTTVAGGNWTTTITPGLIVLCVFLFGGVIVSGIANLLVLLSYGVEKKLRTTFAILVGSLAIADLMVSIVPMPFYTLNILYGYWPLGRVLCGIWVVVDYNTVFASSWMLAAISMDRLWSVKWSIHYRNHNTKKKAVLIVVGVWLLVFAIAMYPTISDRVLRTRDYDCWFVPAENPKFVIVLAFLGHHIPCIIIIVAYVVVFVEIRKLFKTSPQDRAAARAKAAASSAAPATVTAAQSTAAAGPIPGTSKDSAIELVDETAIDGENDRKKKKESSADAGDKKMEPKHQQQQLQQAQQKKQQQKSKDAGTHAKSDVKTKADRERKSFVTLSYIVIGYVVCWVPFGGLLGAVPLCLRCQLHAPGTRV